MIDKVFFNDHVSHGCSSDGFFCVLPLIIPNLARNDPAKAGEKSAESLANARAKRGQTCYTSYMSARTPATLLVVDDDPDLRRTVSLILGADYVVLEARDGQEALSVIEAKAPRLVLLDVAMPGMDGLAVLEAVRRMDKRTIFVMLTGEREISIARRALELGAVSYITKPFDVDFLRAEIQRLLGEASPVDGEYRPWRVDEP